MKNYIRLFLAGWTPCVLALLAVLSVREAQANVLTLDFADGNGTTSVDQYTGIAGSGWKSAWTNALGSASSSYSGTVTNVTPLYTGGDNYLALSWSTTGSGTGTTQWFRTSRQIDSSSISLSTAVTYSFTLRADSTVSNANETFSIFSDSTATNNTSNNNTWVITGDGGGWGVYNGTTYVSLGKVGASALLGTSYQFTIYSDPTTQTYMVTITNLANSTSTSSGTIAWHHTGSGNSENTYLNIAAASGSSTATTFGFSIDNLSVVPEPMTATLVMAGVAFLLYGRRQKRLIP